MPHLNLSARQTVPLQKDSLTIGSDPACDLFIMDEKVAPRHLILQYRGDGWQMATLDLRAKVTVNGEPVTGLRLLRDGDRVRVGDALVFVWREADAPSQRGPWLGLLLIFLSLVAILSLLFAIYRLNGVYLEGALPATEVTPMFPQTTSSPSLEPVVTRPSGHPVYQLSVPSVEEDGP